MVAQSNALLWKRMLETALLKTETTPAADGRRFANEFSDDVCHMREHDRMKRFSMYGCKRIYGH
jgi:hypothetical protein